MFEVGDEYHIVPEDDLRKHWLRQPCWCRPRLDTEVDLIVIHRAYDGREDFEQGRQTS